MNSTFISGLELSELFYREAVRPILENHFPHLTYSAALIGKGSEVLGFDTPQSMDHDWGPRLMLFFQESDHKKYHQQVNQTLRRDLPHQIHGYPTNFGRHEDGTAVMAAKETGPIEHGVLLLTVECFFKAVLSFDPTAKIRAQDWVSVPANRLLMLTAGRVFHDGLGQLVPIREKLRYYPDEVWLYLLSVQWRRIAQQEPFMGRSGQVGDDLGSRLIASRLVYDLMNLCFLMERRYPPFMKWFGSAFARLACAKELTPIFTDVLNANSWEERQASLALAYKLVAQMHNKLSITPPIEAEASAFYRRPFLVIHADRFVDAIRETIKSEEVRRLPNHLGSFDQFVDSTDAQAYLDRFKALYIEHEIG